jgi:Xaa-Pro aminopeptidase
MSGYHERLTELRGALTRHGLGGYVIPLTDEHLGERVASHAQRLAWLTGFVGSAGWAVVLLQEAALFVDGRYTEQVRRQVEGSDWQFRSLPAANVLAWLKERAPVGGKVGYDPWLHTQSWINEARCVLSDRGVEVVPTEHNLVDEVWVDRPRPSQTMISVHPIRFAGTESRVKRADISAWLKAQGADAMLLTALDSVAWVFNIRGQDLAFTPVALAFAMCSSDGTADLFVAPEKLSRELTEHLGPTVRLHPRDSFAGHLATLVGHTVVVDPARTVVAIVAALKSAGARVIEARDPVVLGKAIKNPTEIAGHRAAQARDGIAVTRFLCWLSVAGPEGGVTELSASAKIRKFREESGEFCGLSWETISAAGPNAAWPHYVPTCTSSRTLAPGMLFLIDSGGQYRDGTTDVTRTVSVGIPTEEMRDRFTRVLKGHITLARAIFPAGTRGIQLDGFARQYLWAVGLDYPTGTGHGVGSFLGVHEGPQYIARTAAPTIAPIGECHEPLISGMIVSNEPGYYKPGAYGIRIENLMLVVDRQIDCAESPMLGFEVTTLVPIDRSLIDARVLTPDEKAWVDGYHAEVLRALEAGLDSGTKRWLQNATRPLGE